MMKTASNFLAKLWADESGVSSVEYALLLTFAASGIIFSAEHLGDAVSSQLNGAASCIDTAGGTC